MGRDLRRGMLDVADDRDVAVNDPPVLDRLDRGRGQIDDDVAVAEGKVDAGEPLRARGELHRAHAGGNVHRLERRARDEPGLTQSHARLKALHRGGQVRVPGLGWPARRPPPPRRGRPRGRAACAAWRRPAPWRPAAAARRRSASRRLRRSRRSARRPWRWRRTCRAGGSAPDRSTARFRAAAEAARSSFSAWAARPRWRRPEWARPKRPRRRRGAVGGRGRRRSGARGRRNGRSARATRSRPARARAPPARLAPAQFSARHKRPPAIVTRNAIIEGPTPKRPHA